MQDTVPAIEPLSERDANQYLVRSRMEIANILEGIRKSRTPVAAYVAPDGEFSFCALLHVDDEADRLTLGYGLDKLKNALLLKSPVIFFACAYRGGKIQFTTPRATEIEWKGKVAFSTALPRAVWRLQRRHEPRFRVPNLPPVTVLMNFENLGHVEAELADISLKGIGIVHSPADLMLEPGLVLHGCQIFLPAVGKIEVSLQVQYSRIVSDAEGHAVRRSGCQLVAVPADIQALIQQYVVKLEAAE